MGRNTYQSNGSEDETDVGGGVVVDRSKTPVELWFGIVMPIIMILANTGSLALLILLQKPKIFSANMISLKFRKKMKK